MLTDRYFEENLRRKIHIKENNNINYFHLLYNYRIILFGAQNECTRILKTQTPILNVVIN